MVLFNGAYNKSTEKWIQNLVAYRPLQSDANDHKSDFGISGTTYNGTWSGTAAYGTTQGRTGATFSNNSYINTGVTLGTRPYSFACSMLKTSNYGSTRWTTFGTIKSNNPTYGVGGAEYICCHAGNGTNTQIVPSPSANVRYNIVGTIDGSGNIKYYLNGSLFTSLSGGTDVTGYYRGIARGWNNYGNGFYVAHCAIRDKVLSSEEVEAFNNYVITH